MTLLFVEQAAFTTAADASREIAATAAARPKVDEDLIVAGLLMKVSWTELMSEERREYELQWGCLR